MSRSQFSLSLSLSLILLLCMKCDMDEVLIFVDRGTTFWSWFSFFPPWVPEMELIIKLLFLLT